MQVKSFGNTTDELYLSATVRDVNDFFEQEMGFLSEYNNHLKEATQRSDKMTSKHKGTPHLETNFPVNTLMSLVMH